MSGNLCLLLNNEFRVSLDSAQVRASTTLRNVYEDIESTDDDGTDFPLQYNGQLGSSIIELFR